MDIRFLPLLLVLALPAACDRPAMPPAPPEVPDAPEAPPVPVASAASTPAAPAAGTGVRAGPAISGSDADGSAGQAPPEAFVVSTNEPFWNARVEAGQVVLNGPDVSDRRFAVAAEDTAPGARAVRGRDDAGRTIEVRIAAGSCEDSMSGAVFPYVGSVAIEGGAAASGCARPAGMPPPQVPGDR